MFLAALPNPNTTTDATNTMPASQKKAAAKAKKKGHKEL